MENVKKGMKSVDNGKIWGKERKYGKILFEITFSNNKIVLLKRGPYPWNPELPHRYPTANPLLQEQNSKGGGEQRIHIEIKLHIHGPASYILTGSYKL